MVTLNPFQIRDDFREAKSTAEAAQFTINWADAQMLDAKETLRQDLRKLGKLKTKCFGTTVPTLISILKRINYQPGETVISNKKIKLPIITISDNLEGQCAIANDIAKSTLSGTAGGALTAYAIYNGVGLLATASTGTAIKELSGIAAQRAILAWLGGGTLASGGGGIQLGLQFLGLAGMAVGAVITGIQLSAKAEKAKAEAEIQFTKALEYQDMQGLMITKLRQMAETVSFARSVLKKLNELATAVIDTLNEAIKKFGTDFNSMPQESQFEFYKALTYLELLNAFAQIRVMGEEGEYNSDSYDQFQTLNDRMAMPG